MQRSESELDLCENSKKNHRKKERSQKKRKIFITGLSAEMNRKGLIAYFRSIYPSTINFASKRIGTRHEKIPGFGFLVLGSEEEVRDALKRRLFYYKGRHLKAEPYLKDEGLRRHKEDLGRKRVFVGRIPASMNSQDLWAVLEEGVGPVESAYVVSNSTTNRKKHKGFGYVMFASHAAASKAIGMKKLYVETFMVELNFERPKGRKVTKSNHNEFKDKEKRTKRNSQAKNQKKSKNDWDRKGSDDMMPEFSRDQLTFPSPAPMQRERLRLNMKRQPIPIFKDVNLKGRSQSIERAEERLHQNKLQKKANPKTKRHKKQRSAGNILKKRNNQAERVNHRRTHRAGLREPVPHNFQKIGVFNQKHPQQENNSYKGIWRPDLPHRGLATDLVVFDFLKNDKGRKRRVGPLNLRRITESFLINPDGWKTHSLTLLDHSESNIRINFGKQTQYK